MVKKAGGKDDKKDVVNKEEKKPKAEAVTITKVQEKITGSADESDDGIAQKGDAVSATEIPETSKIQEATKEFLNPKTFGVFVDSIFDQAAQSWGSHWKLQESERDSLSEALCNYLNVVLPEIMKEQPELIVLAMTAGVIIIPRGMQSAKDRKKRKDKGSIPEIHAEAGAAGEAATDIQGISPATA